jgi:hypothetical protein
LARFLGLVDLIAVGVPPHWRDTSPLSLLDWMVLIGLLDLSLYLSVRLVTWLDVKMSSLKLLHELRHELGTGRDRRRPRDGDR